MDDAANRASTVLDLEEVADRLKRAVDDLQRYLDQTRLEQGTET